MKKTLIIIAVAGLSLASCKKDRTCTCTITIVSETVNGVTQPLFVTTATQTVKLTKVTKKGAHCNSGDQTDTRTDSNGNTIVNVSKADCKLS